MALLVLLALAVLSGCAVAGMVRLGALDHPVARSSHTVPTPKGGGVGIAAAFAAGIAVMQPNGMQDVVLALAALGLATASFLDDVLAWPFWVKLAAQFGAAILAVAAGLAPYHVMLPGWGAFSLGVIAVPIGLAWLLFTTNATNFMDGLNGLAAGCAASACLVLAVTAGLHAAWPEALIVAGVAGFLPFNYPSARIFMGDVGSQFLGFLLAALAIRHVSSGALAAILPFGLLPMLLDVGFTLFRRAWRRQRLTEAHRGHIYQVAQRSGVPAWIVSALYWAMSGLAAFCGAAWGAAWDAGHNPLWIIYAVLPFIAWAAFVAARARRSGLGAW